MLTGITAVPGDIAWAVMGTIGVAVAARLSILTV